jgi:hypothetical protein
MRKLSEIYEAAIIEKEHLHPIHPADLYQVIKDLRYAFIGTENPWKDKNPNRTFYEEFKKALRDDEEQQSNMSLCEKLIDKWQRAAFTYEFNTDKRDLEEPEEDSRDKKKAKGSQAPKAIPLAATVRVHCNGCGKGKHVRVDCTSGQDPKHPDFNEEGKWVGCATYKTIKAWLTKQGRGDEHSVLHFNSRADGTAIIEHPTEAQGRVRTTYKGSGKLV